MEEQILDYLTQRVIAYIKEAKSGSVGKQHNPVQLYQNVPLISDSGEGFDGLKHSTEFLLNESVVTYSPRFLEKLYAGTNPVGLASDLLLSVLNTNSHVFTASPALTVIEKYTAKKYAIEFGFNADFAGGLTFPGGSYSNMTSMQMARSLMFPDTKKTGQAMKLSIFASHHCHYSVVKSAIMLGLGSDSVYKVGCDKNGEMDVSQLVSAIRESIKDGYTPFYINATAGTTVYGSFDPFIALSKIAKEHNMWLHIDGSWGGNVVFSKKHKGKLSGCELANSITVNPHKMLGVPCTCSFLLVPDSRQFQTANSMAAGYLFHNNTNESAEDLNFDLADGTMGCGRRPDALKLYLAWRYYGSEGFERRIDHAFEMIQYLADKVQKNKHLILLSTNPPPCLQCCFWFNVDSKYRTKYTRKIVNELHRKGEFLIDYAPHEDGEFFRVVINSPEVGRSLINELVEGIVREGLTIKEVQENSVL